ncbi:hypothetical protein XCCB100_1433 [Xanthomonas campestris pv. campestris]|uniref:Uncharacterized protein n=1 Tax=Xanthomonas campestris pv. campestris (strain B100) TaxID=509169 RepID=B0RQP8_XANCB|nr:hypothetical protein XCCB100_1433 [Xanthomonas campestris pv. campestris]
MKGPSNSGVAVMSVFHRRMRLQQLMPAEPRLRIGTTYCIAAIAHSRAHALVTGSAAHYLRTV